MQKGVFTDNDYGNYSYLLSCIHCMPDKDATRGQAMKDAIDKAKEYIKDKVYDMTGISL